jgi:hypothetical protein
MLSCQHVTKLISESLDHRLPLNRRIALWIHFLVCKTCLRVRKHLLLLRKATKNYDRRAGDKPSSLTPEARERIKRALSGGD